MITCLKCKKQVLMAEAIYNDPAVTGHIYSMDCPYCNPREIKPQERIPIDMSSMDHHSEQGSFAPPINTIGIKDDEVIAAGGTQFETGAVRSGDKNHVMYQLISPIGMRRMAETMKEGFDKYGAYNWERGMPIGDLLNHAIAHLYAFLSGVPSVDAKTGKVEDDLAHAAWNLFAAMHMEETHPELDHGLRPTKDGQPKP